MDRLPRDVAQERMHHDIVQLLDEYRVNSPSITLSNGLAASPPGVAAFVHAVKQKKSRRSSKHSTSSSSNPNTPVKDCGPLSPTGHPRQKPKQKKKRASSQQQQYANAGARSHDGSVGALSPLDSSESASGISDIPPSYESACNGHLLLPQSMHALSDMNMPALLSQPPVSQQQAPPMRDSNHSISLASSHYHQHHSPPKEHLLEDRRELSPQEWLDQVHQPLSNCPAPVVSAASHMTTPGSTAPQSMVRMSTPHSTSTNSSPTRAASNSSPLGVLSPIKKGFPTSPTHMQAMQQHAQLNRNQKSPPSRYMADSYQFHSIGDGLENLPITTLGQCEPAQRQLSSPQCIGAHQPQPQMTLLPDAGSVMEQYPTPPSHHSHVSSDGTPPHMASHNILPDHYLTPSPDSPASQWSSSSPHSANSDWSEGISSPAQAVGITHLAPCGRNTNNKRSGETMFI